MEKLVLQTAITAHFPNNADKPVYGWPFKVPLLAVSACGDVEYRVEVKVVKRLPQNW